MTTRQFQESSALRIFLSYFKPHRKLFFLDMCCALMIAVIDLAFPYVSRWCMYQLLPESAYRTFFAVMAVVFCAYILRSVFTYIICYYGHTFGILVEADIRRDLFRHMQELSFDYYDRNRTGQLMSRLTGRRVCKACGASYHVVNIPPKKEGVCDVCGGELIQRADDNAETVANRIEVYEAQTMPLIAYYEKAGNISHIDGATGLDSVFADIVQALGE